MGLAAMASVIWSISACAARAAWAWHACCWHSAGAAWRGVALGVGVKVGLGCMAWHDASSMAWQSKGFQWHGMSAAQHGMAWHGIAWTAPTLPCQWTPLITHPVVLPARRKTKAPTATHLHRRRRGDPALNPPQCCCCRILPCPRQQQPARGLWEPGHACGKWRQGCTNAGLLQNRHTCMAGNHAGMAAMACQPCRNPQLACARTTSWVCRWLSRCEDAPQLPRVCAASHASAWLTREQQGRGRGSEAVHPPPAAQLLHKDVGRRIPAEKQCRLA